MYIAEIPFASPYYDVAVQLRELLLRKPLGKRLNIIGIRHEYKQHTLGAFDDLDDLLAVVMLKPKSGSTVQLRQMAVKESVQRQGIGQLLVQAAIDLATKSGYEKITCHAREPVIPFYEKSGFKVKGEPFEELGILHQEMERII